MINLAKKQQKLLQNFYVDDLLKSTKGAEEAVSLTKNVVQRCAAGGFKLTKFISNHPDVLSAIPEERALGVLWNTDNDTLCCNINIMEKPLTRRGLLAMLSSIYDPLGLVSPFSLKGRKTIQELCKGSFQWDHPIPENIKQQWIKWKSNLGKLNIIKIARCFKSKNFGHVKGYSVHHFSDASGIGYGQASYLQIANEDGKVHCCLLIGKSCVIPLKFVLLPPLELTAAVLSVKISQQLKQELNIEEDISKVEEFFWTDSQVVLNYISNESKKFKIFVANRVQMIRNNTNLSQWNYVRSADNSADSASRGLNMAKEAKIKQWFEGPAFLKLPKDSWNYKQEIALLEIRDSEVKCNENLVEIKENILTRFERISNWDKMKRVMALVLKFKVKLKQKLNGSGNMETEPRVVTDNLLNVN